jgi:hypothetical protein
MSEKFRSANTTSLEIATRLNAAQFRARPSTIRVNEIVGRKDVVKFVQTLSTAREQVAASSGVKFK